MRAPRPSTAFLVAFTLFAGSVVFSLGGMTALAVAPDVAVRVGPVLPHLMRWPTWAYSAALPASVFLLFLPVLGWRQSLVMAAWGTLVGAAAELVGTATGFPFGAYSYSDFLGVKIAGRVPYAIPPSWYAAALLSFALASVSAHRRGARIALGALYMVLWDVALDPAMSAGFPIWQWHEAGRFYGMPLGNWLGWFATALVIMAGFEAVRRGRPLAVTRWAAVVWSVNGLFALGLSARAGLWPAVLIGAAALAVPPLVALRRRAEPVPSFRWIGAEGGATAR